MSQGTPPPSAPGGPTPSGWPEQPPGGQPWQQPAAPQQPPAPQPGPGGWQQVPPQSPPGAGQMGPGAPLAGASGVAWARVRTLGLVMVALSVLAVLCRVIVDVASMAFTGAVLDMQTGDPTGAAAGLGLLGILVGGTGIVLALALFVLAVIVAVTAREQARIGAIVVAVAVPLSALTYWVVGAITSGIVRAAIQDSFSTGALIIPSAVDVVRILVIGAIYLVGSLMVVRTARRRLSA